jgi:hypothetical protein
MRVVTRGVSSSTVASEESGVVIKMVAAVVAKAASKTCRRDDIVVAEGAGVLDCGWNDQALPTEALLRRNMAMDVRKKFMVSLYNTGVNNAA